MNIQLDRSYSPSLAENGKFVKIDTSTLSDYPVSGFGKYAILVKNIDNLDGNAQPVEVVDVPKTASVETTTLSAEELWQYSLNGDSFDIEIFNMTGDVLYYEPLLANDFAELSAKGIPLANNSYYANTRLSAISLGSVTGGNVRIMVRGL